LRGCGIAEQISAAAGIDVVGAGAAGEGVGPGATHELEAAVSLGQRHGVELPIVEQVYSILYEGKSARTALRELLTRDLKAEAGTLSSGR
jgi:hypothetical protein